MKKILLAIMVLGIVGVCVWFAILFVPRVIAKLHIAELEKTFQTPETARTSYDKLLKMGSRAVPTLIESALQGDPMIDAAKKRDGPPETQGLDWLDEIRRMRRQSAVQYRADACALLLLSAWHDGWVSQGDMALILPTYQDHCLFTVRNRLPLDFGLVEVLLADYQPFSGNEVEGELWLKRRIRWVVDGTEDVSSRGTEHSSRWSNYNPVKALKATKPRKGIFNQSGGKVTPIALDSSTLGLGRHSVLAHVELGPGIPGKRELTDAPPPWQIELAYGPLHFDVVEQISIEAVSNPQLDESITQILNEWKITIATDKKTSKLTAYFRHIPRHFPIAMIGDFTIRVDGEIVQTMKQYGKTNLPGRKIPIDHLAAGIHTIQFDFVPVKERSVRTMFDSYWGAHYHSPMTEFELGTDGEVLRIRRLEKKQDRN